MTTTYDLRFDLQGHSSTTDGWRNPAWVHASDEYDIVSGDLGPGKFRVAIFESNGDARTLRGRDMHGRAVILHEKGPRVTSISPCDKHWTGRIPDSCPDCVRREV